LISGTYPSSFIWPDNLFSSSQISIMMLLVIYCERMQLLVQLNPCAPWLFVHTPFQPQSLNICTAIPIASNCIDVC
jgi:hypothetical protein